MKGLVRSKGFLTLCAMVAIIALAVPVATFVVSSRSTAKAASLTFAPKGNLDCNGYSKIQKPLKPYQICADFKDPDGSGRGYDNGHYVGHDEPSIQFLSSQPNSGNNVKWSITLPRERPLPATQTFENQVAFWFSMALCDPGSFPQGACIPNSDKNNPYVAGSAFLEMQFYPPGFSPFISQVSCDLTHWCASLHINSLECTADGVCNPNCLETTNFAFIQMDGIPTGPAGPASATNASFTPNAQTLLMNQGDKLEITIKDTNNGLINRITDKSTGKSGFMVASAKNGFQSLDATTCAPTNFNFHPEFNTAKFGNFVPWAALQANVGFAVETGHFEVGANGDGDADDAPCFPGPTVAGCLGADVDFDGTSYLPDWPDGTPNNATSLQITSVLGNGVGPVSSSHDQSYTHPYPAMMFETDLPASESTCTSTGAGCTVPPPGAVFYPFYAQSGRGNSCALTFGNDIRGKTINDFGRDLQYGTPDLAWFYGLASGGIRPNPCMPHA
ncbi:MAG: hypothetical protein ABI456_18810 [Ktedonobacteraceae bacterium]